VFYIICYRLPVTSVIFYVPGLSTTIKLRCVTHFNALFVIELA